MCKSKQIKRKYYSNGYAHSQNSIGGVTSDNILNSIQHLFYRTGRVVIEYIDAEEIRVIASLNSIQDDTIEIKLDEIKDMIKDKLGV